MNQPKTNDWAARHAKNTAALAYWTIAWVVTMAIAVFGPEFIWQENESITMLAIVVNLVLGFGMILANRQHLKGLDEMQQKVQLEAMGVSLGVALVAGLSYSTLDVTNVIPFDAEISHLVILIGLVYLLSAFFGMRRYR